MMTLSKILLYVGLVMLLVALVRAGSAAPMLEEPGMEPREMVEPGPVEDMGIERAGAPPAGIPVGMLISEQGVARKDNKTYALRIIVECLMPMEPKSIQKLLASNKSLDEIRGAIGDAPGESMYRGNMKLDDRVYPLTNIRIATYADNVSTLEADVSEPNHDPALVNERAVVGYIRMTIEPSDGKNTGKGELWMNDSYHPGTHSVIINIVSPCDRKMAWVSKDEQEAPRRFLWMFSDKED